MDFRIIDLINRNDLKGLKKVKSIKLVYKNVYIAHACCKNKLNIFKYLISTYPSKLDGWSPIYMLECAVECGHLDIIKVIINKGKIVVNHRHVNTAVENGHLHVVKYFMEKYFDKAVITSGWDLIQLCIIYDQIQICTYLLSRENIYSYDRHIKWALQSRHVKGFIRLFIKHLKSYDYFVPYFKSQSTVSWEDFSWSFDVYTQMKDQVLLLYRIHNSKIPIELQKIIFDYI